MAESQAAAGAIPAGRSHVSHVRVRYAETDQMGVAYYANYLVWFEVARTDWLRAAGLTYRELEAEGLFLPVIEAQCAYRSPARYDDALAVRATARLVSPARLAFDYDITGTGRRRRHRVDRARAARRPRPSGARAGQDQGPHRMKALVTGGAGFIGSHLSERLLDAGAEVIALDSFTDYYPRAIKESNVAALRGRPGYRLVEAAIADADLPALLDGVTHVFHLAAQAGVRKSWGRDFRVYTELNVDATQILLEACVGRPIERVVYASSSSVYGDLVTMPMREDVRPQPVSPYGVTKLSAEQLCYLYFVNHGVPTVSLRYFTVYGPRQRPDMGFHRFFAALEAGRPLVQFGDGLQTRDFTFVADAAAATAAAAVRGVPGRVYNIGGGSRVTLREVFDLLGRITGRPVTVDVQPSQKGDMRDTYADTTLARADLGFRPSVTLEEGLTAMYRWFSTR